MTRALLLAIGGGLAAGLALIGMTVFVRWDYLPISEWSWEGRFALMLVSVVIGVALFFATLPIGKGDPA